MPTLESARTKLARSFAVEYSTTRADSIGYRLAVAGAYIVLYVFLDGISYVFPVFPLGITPWNPPPGATLALLIRFGFRYWPAIPVANILSDYVVSSHHDMVPLALATVAITLIYSSAAMLMKRALANGETIECARDLGGFIGVTMVSTLLVACAYISIFILFGQLGWADFSSQFIRFWIGDVDGILVMTPMLLMLDFRKISMRAVRKVGTFIAQASAVAGAIWVVFFTARSTSADQFYLLFLPLIWIAAVRGIAGATLALMVYQLGLIVAVKWGDHSAATFIQWQLLMFTLCITGLALGIFVTERAVTEANLIKRQIQLSRALQVAAAGEMSSALAHELNQPISAIANYLQSCLLLAESEPAADTLRSALRKASHEARRAGDIVHRIKDFFRAGALSLETLDLHVLLRELIASLHYRADQAGVRFEIRLEADPSIIVVDSLQLESVFNNLLINAIEALESVDYPERLVRLSTRTRGGQLEITVEDTGEGVEPGALNSLFEPFNTTKPKGMGLGLTISRSIIEAHGGTLKYEPAPHRGSRFRCTLPTRRNAGSSHE